MFKHTHFWLLGAFACGSLHLASAQSLNLNWENRYNGQGDSTSKYTCAAMASDGNIVLGGYTTKSTNRRDVLVNKVSPQGNLIWSFTYNGAGDGDDEANAIVTDANGNIYIAATVDDDLLGDDIATFKLDVNGTQQWLSFYVPTMNQDDNAVSIALDASGNVFVAGSSDSNVSPTADNLDYVTIKYDAAGAQLWAKRMNGVGNGDDEAVKLALDAAGNVITTGESDNGNDIDYLTVKYDANGTLVWSRVIDNGDNDKITDIATDAANNVYITGRSTFNDYDFYTVKYNAAGVLQWDNSFDDGNDDRATHLLVNAASEVFVVGRSFNTVQDDNVILQKINATGITAWTTTPYNYTANKADEPFGLQMDAAGNLYIGVNSVKSIVGTTNYKVINLLKYSNTGAFSWAQNFNPNANSNEGGTLVWVENANTLYWGGYAEGSNAQRAAIVRSVDNAGIFKTQHLYGNNGEYSDNIREITRDANGNIYWAGYVTAKSQYRNFAVGKISPTGTTLWVKSLDGTSSSEDEAVGVAIDPSGNILAGGTVKNPTSSSSYDYFIAKLNPTTGDTIFTKTYTFTTNRSDKAAAFTADANGNFYLTGRTNNSATTTDNVDWLTVKWNNNGVFQWAKTYSSAGNAEDKATCIQVSNTGEVYVGGSVNVGTGSAFTLWLIVKYDALGNQQWTKNIPSGPVQDYEEITDLYWNAANDHLYFTGTMMSDVTLLDVVIGELDAAGTTIWAVTDPTMGFDYSNALVVDKNNNAYVSATSTSSTTSTSTNSDVMVMKYDNAGNQVWKKTYNGNNSLNDVADNIALDQDANVYVVGHSEVVSGGSTDMFALVYDSNGNLKVAKTYNGVGNDEDNPSSVWVSNSSEVYVGGGSWGAGNAQRDAIVLKYTYDPSSAILLPSQMLSHSLYPNPMQNTLTIELPKQGKYDVQWKDALGRNLNLAYSSVENTFIFNTANLPNGVYFYQVLEGNQLVATGKVCK